MRRETERDCAISATAILVARAVALSGVAACVGSAAKTGTAGGSGGVGEAIHAQTEAGAPVPLKGVGLIGSSCTDLDKLGVSWFYDWGTSSSCKTNAQFVAQVWGGWPQSDGGNEPSPPARLASAGEKTILGFNEPDHVDQANMRVDQALALWPSFNQPGVDRVGSPATASDGQAWFEQFMRGVAQQKLRVDFIALHWYGWNPGSCTNVGGLEAYIQWAEQWKRPLWLTEWSCRMQSADVTKAFYDTALVMFAKHPLLERYAWFLTRSAGDPNFSLATLLDANGKPTALGSDYIAAPAFH